MSQYDAVALRALAQIRRKGAPITFGDPTNEIYDPLTDTFSGGEALAAGTGVRVASDPVRLQAQGLVLAQPITILVAASGLSIVPAPGMHMTWAGITYSIRAVDPVAPDGSPILYTVTGDA